MIIEKLRIKNLKSYGNVVTEIEFDKNKGGLIFLCGKTGSGKTSILEGLEFTLYGTVRGKNGKRLPLSTLPNRINKDLVTEVDFSTSDNTNLQVIRSLNPSKVKLIENSIPYPKANKIQDRIEEHIGFDLELFKSFVSMSVNDFKNFISLPAEDKRKLFDKLFNMDAINAISKIIRQLKTENELQIAEHKRILLSAENTIISFNESITNLRKKIEEDSVNEINRLKKEINSFKPKFEELTLIITNNDINNNNLKNSLEQIKTSVTTNKTRKNLLQEQITLFEKGSCPTCGTELCSEEHNSKLLLMKKNYSELDNLIKQEMLSYNKTNDALLESNNLTSKTNKDLDIIKTTLTSLKSRITALTDTDSKALTSSIEEFESKIEEFELKKKESAILINENSSKTVYYDKALDVFSELGIKQWMIEKIVEPINVFIAENIKELNLHFNIELDKEFDAKITHMGEEISSESLSNGEERKANMCIMLAYLKLIRMRKHINILFLDETFSSIDIESVSEVLSMFRKFAIDYNVNVILVHHSALDDSLFDRTLKIHKTVFSTIEDSGLIY